MLRCTIGPVKEQPVVSARLSQLISQIGEHDYLDDVRSMRAVECPALPDGSGRCAVGHQFQRLVAAVDGAIEMPAAACAAARTSSTTAF